MNGFVKKDHIWGALLIISFVSILLAISSTGCIPQILNAKRSVWESRAKSTLRAYGETQLAYQNSNNNLHYGTWSNLITTEYIARGYTRGNLIENYSVWESVRNAYSFEPHAVSTFTVIAFPRTTRPPGYLATFAIREDQVLRVYLPRTPRVNVWGENGDFGAKSWEPIR